MGKQEKTVKTKQQGFMKMLENAPISKKLTISHGVIIAVSSLIIVILLGCMVGITRYVERMYTGPVTNASYVGDFRYALSDISGTINHARAEETFAATDASGAIEKDWNLMETAYQVLKDTLMSKDAKEKLDHIYNNMSGMRDELDTLLEMLSAGQIESAGQYYDDSIKALVEDLQVDVEELNGEIHAVSKEYCVHASRIALLLVCIGSAELIFTALLAINITKRVTKMISLPLLEVTAAAEKMRQGDMGAYTEIKHESEDELGTLSNAMRGTMTTLDGYIKEISAILKQMAQGDLTKNYDEITDFLGDFASVKESFGYILKEFKKTLSDINAVSDQVDKGSDEIATSANELAASTEEQASAVEELTATISTVSTMALENAKGAETAYESVLASVQDAEDKRGQVQELQAEMQRIKDISAEISNIITTIEEIADQTSLLSLNASIEAARAGEAGRGFAVVADQIGKLATDSAQAAVNTKELIEKTVAEIEKGNAITEATAVAFDTIIEQMTGFAGAANGSKEMAEEQAAILKQVEEGINEVASVTQENAASAEESLATSEELAARAAELAEQVNKFKLH